ncbi:amino acid permease-domain-containing protein [Naematelia encephala]|uniref:Amino acid permease-domain-containing protein n=1 Tax=Naematelia encephala TaxID=71784 RepID=A0A1Y2B068_9TREE|nr:amino acid permease-domain-containing protein [Naematelia encephala]
MLDSNSNTPRRRPPFVSIGTPDSSLSSTGTGTQSSISSLSFLQSSAPTPFNTYSGDDSFASRGIEEMLYHDGRESGAGGIGNGELSVDPSITPTTSRNPSTYSHGSSAYLLPLPHTPLSVESNPIPISTKPIPDSSIQQQHILPIVSSNRNGDGDGVGVGVGDDGQGVKYGGSELETSTSHGSRNTKGQDEVDAQRLQQLGYDAVLGRDLTFWSSLAISSLNIGALQGTVYAVSGTYKYGGPMMILVAWPISGFCSLFLTLSMSELASAYPVSGAMASWAWKAARGGVGGERGWGWLMGGTVIGGHVANLLLVTWEICDIITGTMNLAFTYQHQAWHSVLFFLAVILICGLVGSFGWGRSHRFWLGAGIYGFIVWITLCITLLSTGATHHPNRNLTQFKNTTGWSSKGYVYLLGWEYCTIASGADASAHMAEETQNPSRNVPNAMTMSMVVTYVLGYISIVLLLLSITTEDMAEVASHSFPVGYILERATNRHGAIGICCLLVIVLVVQVLAQLQASSRFVFALARDNAMPFSETIRRTNSSKQPIFANWLVCLLCAPFAGMVAGPESTLYSVLAVTASCLSYIGYFVPVALYLFSKLDLQTEGRSSWSLRKFSKPFGVIGVIYGIVITVVECLPSRRPVTVASISWGPIVMVGTGLLCLITWKLYGAKHYSGPIRAMTKWQTGVEIDLQSTLASRSKTSAPTSDIGRERPTDSSLKLDGDDPFFSEIEPTVTVASARTIDSHDISSAEWTSGTESSGTESGGTVTQASEGTGSRSMF